MKKLLLLALAALLTWPVAAQDKVGTVAAPFLGIGMGARASGMGWAQVASAQGPSALYWNPSGITDMTTSGVEFSNAEWLVDTRLSHLGFVFNAGGLGHFGLSVTALDYGEQEVTTISLPEGTGERWSALDLAVGLSYARALTDRFSVGGTAKLVRQTIWNEAASGAAIDLGVTYLTGFRNLRIGAAMTNFGTSMQMNGQDLRQAIDIDPNNEGNNPRNAARLETDDWSMPLIFRVGVAVDAYSTANQRLTVSVDGLAPADNAQNANFGAEYSFRELFFVRGGFRQAFASNSDDSGWTAGVGLRYGFTDRLGAYVDYVFQEYDPFGTLQMFSLGVTF
jgi:hypothetical protein